MQVFIVSANIGLSVLLVLFEDCNIIIDIETRLIHVPAFIVALYGVVSVIEA